MAPRGRKKDGYHHGDLRRAMLDAALDILSREGPGALTVRGAARTAGVSHAAPYHHFPDKESILAALVDEGFLTLTDGLLTARDRARNDPQARLAACARAYLEFAAAHPSHYRLLFRAPPGDTLPREPPNPAHRRAFEVLMESVAACLGPRASKEKVEDRALLAWALLHGLATLFIDGPLRRRGKTVEDLSRTATESLKALL